MSVHDQGAATAASTLTDPREVIAETPMGLWQWVAVLVCVLLNALDGFDVLSISFASPGIAKEWGIDRAALGIVLSMELIGMAIGSVILGNVTDRIGRRPMALACLVVMSGGMYLASTADSVGILSTYRFLTGIGIGGMLAATNALVAEFSNKKHKTLAISLMAGGYPFGAIVGGEVVSRLLANGHDWRSIFVFGAICTAVLIPITLLLVPETIAFLVHKRPANVVEKINKELKRFGHNAISGLPAHLHEAPKTKVADLFSKGLARATILLTVGYFFHIMTFYFILKWIPKIVVDMGFPASEAGGVLVWANVGGMLGAVVVSLLSLKLPTRYLVIAAMLGAVVMVSLFGRADADLDRLSLAALAAGFCTNGAIVGIYALIAMSFPAGLRAGGTGFVIGLGRGGAALGPIVAGFLFNAGMELPSVAMIMALGSLIAAGMFAALRTGNEHAH